MGTKRKIVELEYLRAFAFLAVVLQHTIGHYAYEPNTHLEDGVMLGGLLLLSKFAVPMFIFISGMVLFYKYQGSESIAYLPFLRKRSKDILLPYVSWAVLYAFIQEGLFTVSWHDMLHLTQLLLTGKASYHLWYVVMIFQFYLLFPVLHAAILWMNRKLSANRLLFAGLAGMGVLYVGLTSQVSILERIAAGLSIPGITELFGEYSDRNALYFFYYFVLGAFAGLHLERFGQSLLRWRRIVIGLFGLLIVWMWYRIIAHFKYTPELKIHYNDTFLIQPPMAVVLIFSVLAMYLFAISFARSAPIFWRNTMSVIGSYSYVAYLAHALLLMVATGISDWFLPYDNPTLRTLLAFVLCSVLSVAAAILIRWLFQVLRRLLPNSYGQNMQNQK